MNFFEEINIIEPLVKMYDFKYSQYVLNLPFKSGFKLYMKCINNMNEEIEKEEKDKLWELWLIEIQHGCKLNFEDYYKSSKIKYTDRSLDISTRETEEQRIMRETQEHRKNMKFLN